MIRDHFRILTVDLATGKGRIVTIDGRDTVAGGSGLAALLFDKYGHPDKPWDSDRLREDLFKRNTGDFDRLFETIDAANGRFRLKI